MSKESSDAVRSVIRALSLLDILAQSRTERPLCDIAQAAELPSSTVHRLLNNLVRLRYVTQNRVTANYALGENLILLGRKAEQQHDVRHLARPWLEKLAEETHETVNLTAMVGDSVVQLDHVDSPSILRVAWDSGQRFPLYCSASGKVFLAYSPKCDQILETIERRPYTKRTIVDSEQLRAELDMVRQRGYAIDDAEREEGVRCVAAPNYDARGSVVAAISISGPSVRLSLSKLHELAGRVIKTAGAISASLGYRTNGSRKTRRQPVGDESSLIPRTRAR